MISAALYVLAPLVLRFYLLLNHGSSKAAEQAVGTSLLRMFSPQVFLLGTIVVSTALLNARRRFAAAAFSPVANNLIAIAAILATRAVATNLNVGPFRHEHKALLILGLGTTLGYLVQLLVQLPAMRRAGIRIWPDLEPAPSRRPEGGRPVGLARRSGRHQPDLPQPHPRPCGSHGGGRHGVHDGISVLPAALRALHCLSGDGTHPRTGRAMERRRPDRVPTSHDRRLARLPRGPGPCRGRLCHHRSAAHPGSRPVRPRHPIGGAHNIASSLALFAIGLPGFSAFILLMRAYQAMQDARTMFWMYVLENAITLTLAAICYPLIGVSGLALAWVAPYSVVAIVAAVHLQRRTGSLGGALTVRALSRILVAGAVMTAALFALNAVLPHGAGHVDLVLRLVVLIGAGTLVYGLAARALGISEVDPMLRLLRRRH